MVDNALDDFIYGASTKRRQPNFGFDDYGDDADEPECDPDGSIAICDDCNKVVGASALDRHKSFFCKSKMAECPICNEKYPMHGIGEHMEHCETAQLDKTTVKCQICGLRMPKDEATLKDHAIAHNL